MNRFSRVRNLIVLAITATILAWIAPSRAAADDFRIETKVFAGKEAEPVSENLTLFRGGQVYDFLNKPNEITLFDERHGRVVLLDPVRRVKTEVKMERLLAFSTQLKARCAKQADPFYKFAAEPRFEETLDDASGESVFTSPYWSYRVATIKANTEEVARQYREFSDTEAQLNALVNPGPGSAPPFPRLAINESLFRGRLIPERVQRTFPSHGLGGKPTIVRSEHSVNWRLLESDQEKINEAGEFLARFIELPLEKYLKADAAAERH